MSESLYREVQELARAKEWSFAEALRRNAVFFSTPFDPQEAAAIGKLIAKTHLGVLQKIQM